MSEEDIKILEDLKITQENCIKAIKTKNNPFTMLWQKQNQAIENIINKCKEQEKVIELMAKDIAENKLDEDICRQVKDPNNEDCYTTLYYDHACSDCVIEYYKKKAKESD